MKVNMHTAILHGQNRHPTGGAFAYVIACMTLSAMLLALSGSTLHSILRTSDADRKMFREIHVTEASAADLRDDGRRCVSAQLNGNDLTLELSDSSSAVWTTDKHQLLREVTRSGNLQSRRQFRFQPGTQLTFRQESERLFILRITAVPLAYLSNAPSRSEGIRAFIDVVFSTRDLDSTL